MAPTKWAHHRCSYCCQFLRSKSSPIPADQDGNRDVPEKAAEHAASCLAEVNETLKANQRSPLTFDSDMFDCDGQRRLHYQDGKQCFAIVQTERKEEASRVGTR